MNTPEEILKKYWGHEFFRAQQKEIIQSVLDKKDTLALLPTGGGKSVCFQIPALLLQGICLVVTPLIALMKDQIENLKSKGITALAVYSGMTFREIDIVLDRCVYDQIKFLYVSPERLKTEIFIERLKKMQVCLLAIDEAHCISQWGYDFRPSYLEISAVRKIINKTPVIALTATATLEVAKDIQDKLLFPSYNLISKSFYRKNLSYTCLEEESKEKKLLDIIKKVNGLAIVYVRSRIRAQKIAHFLILNKISSTFYHAGLTHEARNAAQIKWIKNEVNVIVATNAFGMGIDKSNVRLVVHLDVPESIEAYYQEAGRAGRDEKKAYAVLLFYPGDFIDLREKFELKYPELTFIKRVYQSLANYLKIAVGSSEFTSYDFDIDNFSNIYNLKKKEVHIALKILERESLLLLNDTFFEPSKIFFLIKDQQLYEYQVANPQYDGFIKILMRIYGGEIFSNFITVSEKFLGDNMGQSESEIENKLKYLAANDIILYIKQNQKPQLTFLTPRQDATNLSLDLKKINSRKIREKEKLDAMIFYSSQKNICRSIVLSEYFGETDVSVCNVCDICITNRKLSLEGEDKLKDLIVSKLQEGPVSLEELKKIFHIQSFDYGMKVIREMMDSNLIEMESNGKLKLKN